MAVATKKRAALEVRRDSDGGLTIRDPQSDLMLSVMPTNPDANGPRGLYVEVYAYQGGDVMWQEATRREVSDETPLSFGIARHPTIAFYGESR
jgi:hypothetical protein